jgi:predicted nucleic acid-binding Zn ribbon protein
MEVPFWFLMPDSGNGYIPVVLHPDDANKGNYSPIVAVKRDLTYNVTFHSDGQGGFTSVDIHVQGVIDVPKYTAKNKGGGLNKTYNATRIQMNGTYYITDSVETNNETI